MRTSRAAELIDEAREELLDYDAGHDPTPSFEDMRISVDRKLRDAYLHALREGDVGEPSS